MGESDELLAGKLNIVSWNVFGVGQTCLDDFLKDLGDELEWDILLLQEFTANSAGWVSESTEGHSTYIQPPCPGRGCGAIVVRSTLAHQVDADSFCSQGRACSLTVRLGVRPLFCICAHLDPGGDLNLYSDSLDDVAVLLDKAKAQKAIVVVGVDAQDRIGPTDWDDCDDDPRILGTHCECPKGRKGDEFVRFCMEHDLIIHNSMFPNSGDHFTYCKERCEPRQIDYVCSNMQAHRVVACAPQDATATVTDHRPVQFSFSESSRRARAVRSLDRPSKPLNWRLTSHGYNDCIRADIGLPEKSLADEWNCIHIYTDGSCKKMPRNTIYAGWGFAVFDAGGTPVDDSRLRLVACGPVVTQPGSKYHLGANRRTNNTAEMSAFIELLLFLLGHTDDGDDYQFQGKHIRIHTDSKYVLGLAENRFRARENVSLAALLVHLLNEVKKHFTMEVRWTPGHKGIFGNELADQLANKGGNAEYRSEWWTRPYGMTDWNPEGFRLTLQTWQIDSQVTLETGLPTESSRTDSFPVI